MFTGVSCFEKSGHHDLYNFDLLCHNAAMRTLCRAKWKSQGIAPPAVTSTAKVRQRNYLEKASPTLPGACPLFNRQFTRKTLGYSKTLREPKFPAASRDAHSHPESLATHPPFPTLNLAQAAWLSMIWCPCTQCRFCQWTKIKSCSHVFKA